MVTPKNEPLLQQYREMKKKHPDDVLLFRVGDFYETFGKDTVIVSKILGLTLTRRQSGVDSRIELAGFPHHALDTYLPKLVRTGKRVAICEQLEDPKRKKTFKRDEPTPKPQPSPYPAPKVPTPEPRSEPPKSSPAAPPRAPSSQPKEVETDDRVNYNDNPDPRLFQYNLFGELEPIGKPQRQPRQEQPSEEKPKLTINLNLDQQKKFRLLSQKELDFYGSLDWETNPPINGYYETMMAIAHRQLAEMEAKRQAMEVAKRRQSPKTVLL